MTNVVRYTAVVLLLFVFFSCSKSDDGNTVDDGNGYAKFSKSDIMVSSKGGQSSAVVVWDNVEWEIEPIAAESFITNISPPSGGEIGKSDLTTITFTLSKNNTPYTRSQDLYVVNKQTGQKEKVVINQDKLPFMVVYPNTKYQNVVGFGGMYNPTIWLSANNLIDANELATMYDPSGKLKYSILRLMVYADKTKWAADVAGALQAQNYGAIIFACPWYPAKTLVVDSVVVNNKKVGHLSAANYNAYADHLIEYVNYMKANGVNIYAISVQNEPDMEFTYWTPAEVATFTANYGAKIRASGVKLISPEACGFQSDYTNAILNSSDAFTNADIVAGHLYQGFTDLSSNYVKTRHDYVCNLYPSSLAAAGKSWWMTEKLFNAGQDETDVNKQEFKKWSYNLASLGLEMHMCMDGYCSAYVYWYLKRFYGMIGDNDPRSVVAEGGVMKNGYIMAHYAAYATKTTRIRIDSPNSNILATAYINESGDEITVVVLNMSGNSYETFLETPVGMSSHSAVETNAEYDMKEVETVLSDDLKHLYLKISAQSIYSLRLKLQTPIK